MLSKRLSRTIAATWKLCWPIGLPTLRHPRNWPGKPTNSCSGRCRRYVARRARTRDELEQVSAALGYHGPCTAGPHLESGWLTR